MRMVQQLSPPRQTEVSLRLTYEEFLDWATEHPHAEWVDGEVIEYMTVSLRHSEIVVFFIRLIGAYLDHRHLGRVFGDPYAMLIRSESDEERPFVHRQPDVAVVLTANVPRATARHLEGPADLAVEVVSDDSATQDRTIKRREYAAAGVPEYLIIEGREGRHGVELLARNETGIYERVPPDARGRLISTVVPGFWLDPAWFAEDPLPDVDDVLDEIVPGIHEERARRAREKRAARRGAE
jgi:Uma2 family endonuclease